MLCYSVDSTDSLFALPKWQSAAISECCRKSPLTFAIIGCKSDLREEDLQENFVKISDARQLASSIGAIYCGETSAKEFINIRAPFCYLALLQMSKAQKEEFDGLPFPAEPPTRSWSSNLCSV